MRLLLTPEQITSYQAEILAWATYNFDNNQPHLGIIEELGEYCHAELKGIQKIRGFDKPEKVMEAKLDSIVDATVFLLHWSAIHGVKLATGFLPVTPETALSSALHYAADILALTIEGTVLARSVDPKHDSLDGQVYAANRLLYILHYLAEEVSGAGLPGSRSLPELLEKTWREEVQPRDFRKYPGTGRPDPIPPMDPAMITINIKQPIPPECKRVVNCEMMIDTIAMKNLGPAIFYKSIVSNVLEVNERVRATMASEQELNPLPDAGDVGAGHEEGGVVDQAIRGVDEE